MDGRGEIYDIIICEAVVDKMEWRRIGRTVSPESDVG